MRGSILIVDDESQIRDALRRVLQGEWVLAFADSPSACVAAYERERPDLVLMDYELPGLTGLQLLEVLRERDPDATVVMLTGQGDIALAVEAMRLGAENFLTKPIDPPHIQAAVARAYEKAELRRQNRAFRETQARQSDGAGLGVLGESDSMKAVARQMDLMADGTAPVLLTGETGTGKGWVAKRLHALSPRARAPFVEVNCAGLTATFLDSELFGHEKGAFTDAKTMKQGLFEVADGGTLFLDEIGDLAPELQPKLLKVLESKRFRRLGATREIEVDVRLVAATHKDLKVAVREGRFREDLYYRLAVFPLHLPPLRERGREAVLGLAAHFVSELRRRMDRAPATISPEALALLTRHSWPGNIRELHNTLERMLMFSRGEPEVRPEHLPPELHETLPELADDASDEALTLDAVERRHIARVLARCGNNRAQAARVLGISRATLYKKLESL